MTGEYTFVTPDRQNELTRRIQEKLARASEKIEEPFAPSGASSDPDFAVTLADKMLATTIIQ
jgi:hypothetical protein